MRKKKQKGIIKLGKGSGGKKIITHFNEFL